MHSDDYEDGYDDYDDKDDDDIDGVDRLPPEKAFWTKLVLKSQDGAHRWNRYDREGAANPLLSPASSAFRKLKASLETKVTSKISFKYV